MPAVTPAARAGAGSPPPGFNVFGYLTSNLGLGVAARNTVEMMLARDLPVRLIDVDPGGGMRGGDDSLADAIERTRGAGPYAVNLFHINPDEMIYLLDPLSGRVPIAGTLQACVPFWELPRLPRSWIAPLSAMDAILAPTRYVRDIVLADLPHARVLHYPQTARVPDGIGPDRGMFGLPADAIVFVMSFDMRSDIERKNPWAAIDAFSRAFPGRADVRLVIKVNNATTLAGSDTHVSRLRTAASDPRISVIDEPMPYRDVLTLYASCDAFVSLHRAEGLGLALLEAMYLGRPVIATAWSGNMDFMTPENSCPVGYRMVPVVSSTQPAYGERTSGKQEWADPDVDEAADRMRRLADDPALRASVGERARTDALRIRATHARGAVFDDFPGMAPTDPRHRRMLRLRRAYPINLARWTARVVWRRAKTAMTRRRA